MPDRIDSTESTAPVRLVESKVALVIGTSQYLDPGLRRLRAPGQDANEFAHVLADPDVGGFDVVTLLNSTSEGVRRTVAEFCADRGPGDLMLVYLSCHGILDESGRLYYAMMDTQRRILAATGLSAAWLNEQLEDSRCKRQVLILDCCHSGAFARDGKGEGDLSLRARFEGRGRAVLTASGAQEYSFEGDDPVGTGATSVFTHALIAGLRTGAADLDGDGLVTVGELYRHAFDRVRDSGHAQSPELWSTGTAADLIVARNRRGVRIEAALSPDLLAALRSERVQVREGAVAALAGMLDESPEAARVARQALEIVAAVDNPRVAALAASALRGSLLDAVTRPVRLREPPTSQPQAATAPVHLRAAGPPGVPEPLAPSSGSPAGPGLDAASPTRGAARDDTPVERVTTSSPSHPAAEPAKVRDRRIGLSVLAAVIAVVMLVAGIVLVLARRSADEGAAAGGVPSSSRGGSTLPGPVPWIHLSGATQTTVAMSWGEAADAGSYELGYRMLDPPGTTFSKSGYSLRGDAVPVVFHALTPGNRYEFWVRGVNDAGAGPAQYSQHRTRTPAEAAEQTVVPSAAVGQAPPGAVPWIHVGKVTVTTVDVSWGQASGGLQYQLAWRALDGSGKAFSKGGYAWHGDDDPVTFHDLEPGTAYEFTVSARNNGGSGPLRHVQGRTLD